MHAHEHPARSLARWVWSHTVMTSNQLQDMLLRNLLMHLQLSTKRRDTLLQHKNEPVVKQAFTSLHQNSRNVKNDSFLHLCTMLLVCACMCLQRVLAACACSVCLQCVLACACVYLCILVCALPSMYSLACARQIQEEWSPERCRAPAVG